jgi:hypothetical protein
MTAYEVARKWDAETGFGWVALLESDDAYYAAREPLPKAERERLNAGSIAVAKARKERQP